MVTVVQEGHSNLTLQHDAQVFPLTSSHHVGILSSHTITRRVMYGHCKVFWGREPIHITFMIVHFLIALFYY